MVPDKGPNVRGATSDRLLNGRYELGEKVGEGSFFAVYRGRDTRSGRAVALTWGVSRHLLDIPWRPAPWLAVAGALVTTALVGIVGVSSSYDVLRKKPLGTLRAE